MAYYLIVLTYGGKYNLRTEKYSASLVMPDKERLELVVLSVTE